MLQVRDVSYHGNLLLRVVALFSQNTLCVAAADQQRETSPHEYQAESPSTSCVRWCDIFDIYWLFVLLFVLFSAVTQTNTLSHLLNDIFVSLCQN